MQSGNRERIRLKIVAKSCHLAAIAASTAEHIAPAVTGKLENSRRIGIGATASTPARLASPAPLKIGARHEERV